MNESDDDASQSALLAWHDRVSALHGARVALPPRAEWDARAYRQLFGERARARERHSLFVVVLHCGKPGREHMVARWREGYLKTKRHVFASDRTDVALGTLGFPDDPGVPHRDFRTAGRYPGAHRPLTAILLANDTWGGRFDWLLHGDDDTMLYLEATARALARTPPATPLLLGLNGPRTPPSESPVCRAPGARARPRVGCCARTSADAPFEACPVDVARGDAKYFATVTTATATAVATAVATAADAASAARDARELAPVLECGSDAGREHFCCPVSPSGAARAAAGFPYALDTARGTSPYSFVRAWVFGGDGYVLSAGLLRAVGRARWAECDALLVCGNADQRVTTCVFDHGVDAHRR